MLLSQLYFVLLSQLTILRMLREGVRPCEKFFGFSKTLVLSLIPAAFGDFAA